MQVEQTYGRRHRKSWREGKGIKEFDYNGKKWKNKAEKIKRRDKYRCVWCRRYGKTSPAEVVHHIKRVEDYPELAFENENLVSLCRKCHNKAHPEKVRAARGIR